jgi:hypothetical protein
MGDFDRTKGHAWRDPAAVAILKGAGIDHFRDADTALVSPASEDFFRQLVIREVTQDPGWYMKILGKRILATIFQAKLWPYHQGVTYSHKTSPSEGTIDGYYSWTRTIDLLGMGGRLWEIPIPVLLAPIALLMVMAFRGPSRARIQGAILCLLSVGVGGLAFPVLMTTAGAFETEVFALVYVLGWAFFLDETVRTTREHWRDWVNPLSRVSSEGRTSGQ